MDAATVKYVITSPLSLARIMWWYGEDELWTAAFLLEPAVVADLAPRLAGSVPLPRFSSCCGQVRHWRTLIWRSAPSSTSRATLGRRHAGIDVVNRCRTRST